MKQFFRFAAIAAALASVFACNKVEAPQTNEADQLLTKAYDETGVNMVCYVETNDVNPLNAGDYTLANGSPFFDIVELFAANIHKDDAGNPTLYLNDKLTPVLEDGGVEKYVRPLQEKGIKVLLSVIGNWQHIGLANSPVACHFERSRQTVYMSFRAERIARSREIYITNSADFSTPYGRSK